jgi:hypothetical protein
MKFTVQSALIAVLGLLLCLQGWTLSDVKARLAAVEQTLANESAEQVARSSRGATRTRRDRRQSRGDVATKTANASPKLRADAPLAASTNPNTSENATVIEAAVADEFERRESERKQAERDGWVSIAAQRFEMQLEAIADDHNLGLAVQNQVLDILVDSAQQGIDIRQDFGAGEVSLAEAKEEGAALKAETAEAVEELLGEPAAEALWAEMKGDGGR